MDCRADGFPKPTIAWMKALGNEPSEYQEVPLGSAHILQHENGSLQIINARQSDRGYYLCKANNGIGAGLSQVVHLYVHVPAHFQTKYNNVTAKIGDSAHLLCEAMGDKLLTIAWYMDRRQLHPGGNPKFHVKEDHWEKGVTSRLVIISTERQDGGTYSCVVHNEYGEDKSVIYLTVQEYPSMVSNIQILDSTSRSVQLKWIAPHDGNSRLIRYTIQYKPSTGIWYSEAKNSTVLAPETSHVITGLIPSTRYHLRIFAINEVGVGPPSDIVEVVTTMESPGGPPRDVQVIAVDPKTLKVSWKPPKHTHWHGEISGYNVGYKIYDSTEAFTFKTIKGAPVTSDIEMPQEEEMHITLHSLKKFTKYGVVVQAFNRLGAGPKSEEVVTRTLEDAPSKPPENVRCSPQSSQSILVSWEPPPQSGINGQLQGYRVLYVPANLYYDGIDTESMQTSAWKTIIHGLERFRNYSVQALGFTRVGDGVKSRPIFCQTQEDVPDAPEDIKALILSSDAILIVWKPPKKNNGIITKYTLYSRNADSALHDMTKHLVSSEYTLQEVWNLREGRRYEFWVTASTSIGEGQSTKVVSQIPGPNVPARMAGFSNSVISRWRDNIVLPCRAVGIPSPEYEWKFLNQPLQKTERIFWELEGNLQILDVQSTDAGNYSCSAENIHGSDKIFYELSVQAPPGPPVATIGVTSFTSITVNWKPSLDDGAPIEEFLLYYKRDFGEWEETTVSPKLETWTLENLWCGTRYQLYMTARNRIGIGEASQVKMVRTKGSAPDPPPSEKLLRENSTFIMLNLMSWGDGGCPMLYFVVEYKLRSDSDWMLVSNNVKMQRELFPILDLQPDLWYHLRVTAHNNAGSTVAAYEFVTRSNMGATSPGIGILGDTIRRSDVDLKILFPIMAFTIVVITASLALYCFYKHRDSPAHQGIYRDGVKQYEARYLSSTSKMPKSLQPRHFDKAGDDGTAREDLHPYATYQIPPDCKPENFTAEDWKKYEVYAPGHSSDDTSRAAANSGCSGSGNIYPMLKKEETSEIRLPTNGPDSSLSDDQEYASPVRSSDTSDSNSGSCQARSQFQVSDKFGGQGDTGAQSQKPRPIDKLRKPGRRAKVPDLIYRRQQECYATPLTPPGEDGESLSRTQAIKIPRPQLEKPSAPAESAILDTTFSFLDNMGSSQDSSDTQKKDDNGDVQSSRDSSSTECDNKR